MFFLYSDVAAQQAGEQFNYQISLQYYSYLCDQSSIFGYMGYTRYGIQNPITWLHLSSHILISVLSSLIIIVNCYKKSLFNKASHEQIQTMAIIVSDIH